MEYGLSKKQTSLSSDNSGQNILDKFLKLREKDLAMKSFNIDFQHFLAWLSKFLFCVASWSFLLIVYLSLNTNIKSEYLQEELKKIIINKPLWVSAHQKSTIHLSAIRLLRYV